MTLKNAIVTNCTATAEYGAEGGGVFALGSLTMKESELKYNTVNGGGGIGDAGGAYCRGFRAYYSSVSKNSATSSNTTYGYIAGIFSGGSNSVYLYNSSIDGNTASGSIGGLRVEGDAKVKIVNSTISSNAATTGLVGGAYLRAETILIANSTIAANTAHSVKSNRSAGLALGGYDANATITMQSSLVAGNFYGASPPSIDNDLSSSIVVTGTNNLVRTSNASLPADTITGKCAFLGPLKDNGGLTLTHALKGHSPALNAGNNTFGASFDQRGRSTVNGDGDFPRVLGPPRTSPRADIGAYEADQTDEIFDSDFDSC